MSGVWTQERRVPGRGDRLTGAWWDSSKRSREGKGGGLSPLARVHRREICREVCEGNVHPMSVRTDGGRV